MSEQKPPRASPFSHGGLAETIALVTGGSRGIGREIALALAREGAAVAVSARQTAEFELRAIHDRVITVCCDVTDRAAVDDMVSQTALRLGPIDFLVNNAGSAGVIGPIWETDPDDWWREVEVNLRGPMLCARAVLPSMIGRRRGRIINMASSIALSGYPYTSAYSCSKAALVRLTDSLHEAVAQHGVWVFATSPGRVRTAMVDLLESAEASRKMPWTPPARIAELCVRLARGDGDALAGRFIHVMHDLDEMRARADEIARDELYQLRLHTLPAR